MYRSSGRGRSSVARSMRCAIASIRRSVLSRLVEQPAPVVRRVLRRPVLALSGCKLELLADPQQLLNEVRACPEVVPLEGAAALDDGSAGLPERAGRLGADVLLPGECVKTAMANHWVDF